MPKVTKSVKKNQHIANPYLIGGLKASYPGTPLKDQGYSNKVETVATAVDRVYVTHVIRPEGNGAAYTKPMKEFFESKGDPALMADWNCHGFKTRRAYDPKDPKKNEKFEEFICTNSNLYLLYYVCIRHRHRHPVSNL